MAQQKVSRTHPLFPLELHLLQQQRAIARRHENSMLVGLKDLAAPPLRSCPNRRGEDLQFTDAFARGEPGISGRPWIQRTNLALQDRGTLAPIEFAVLPGELRRVGG